MKKECIKSKQLEMSFSTANGRLRKMILFDLVCKLGLNVCHRCGEPMNLKTLSIDHKEDWLHREVELFWDMENIAFSHLSCNNAASTPRNKVKVPEGHLYCSRCKKPVPIEDFSLKQTEKPYQRTCRNCHKLRMRRVRKKKLDAVVVE